MGKECTRCVDSGLRKEPTRVAFQLGFVILAMHILLSVSGIALVCRRKKFMPLRNRQLNLVIGSNLASFVGLTAYLSDFIGWENYPCLLVVFVRGYAISSSFVPLLLNLFRVNVLRSIQVCAGMLTGSATRPLPTVTWSKSGTRVSQLREIGDITKGLSHILGYNNSRRPQDSQPGNQAHFSYTPYRPMNIPSIIIPANASVLRRSQSECFTSTPLKSVPLPLKSQGEYGFMQSQRTLDSSSREETEDDKFSVMEHNFDTRQNPGNNIRGHTAGTKSYYQAPLPLMKGHSFSMFSPRKETKNTLPPIATEGSFHYNTAERQASHDSDIRETSDSNSVEGDEINFEEKMRVEKRLRAFRFFLSTPGQVVIGIGLLLIPLIYIIPTILLREEYKHGNVGCSLEETGEQAAVSGIHLFFVFALLHQRWQLRELGNIFSMRTEMNFFTVGALSLLVVFLALQTSAIELPNDVNIGVFGWLVWIWVMFCTNHLPALLTYKNKFQPRQRTSHVPVGIFTATIQGHASTSPYKQKMSSFVSRIKESFERIQKKFTMAENSAPSNQSTIQYSERVIHLNLENIMEIPATQELFVNHLKAEFSLENYLFWVESDLQRWLNDKTVISNSQSNTNLVTDASFDGGQNKDRKLQMLSAEGRANGSSPTGKEAYPTQTPERNGLALDHSGRESPVTGNSDKTIYSQPSYDELLTHARELYHKYVHHDALLQINISGTLAKSLTRDLFEKHKTTEEIRNPNETAKSKSSKRHMKRPFSKSQVVPTTCEDTSGSTMSNSFPSGDITHIQTELRPKLIYVFDAARDEVWKIMERDSFERFKSTSQFQTAVDIFTHQGGDQIQFTPRIEGRRGSE